MPTEHRSQPGAQAQSNVTQVLPIQAQDLADVGNFLHQQLAQRISPQAWVQSLSQRWAASQPNHGMHLRHDGQVVGVLCAIYSDQTIDGRTERFCNPHSWMVLEPYRSHSLGLVLQLMRQRGYHFTMFTPNPKVAQVFVGLRFRLLEDSLLYFPNLPSPAALGSSARIEHRREHIAALLDGTALADFQAHQHLPWLEFVAFGRTGDSCLAIYKRSRWKKMACAALSYVSDAQALQRHGALLRHHLLRRGMPVSRIEGRHLSQAPTWALQTRRGQPKLVLSPSLSDRQVRDVYSEMMALDL